MKPIFLNYKLICLAGLSIFIFIVSCKKEPDCPSERNYSLSANEKECIPYNGMEKIKYVNDNDTIVFSGTGRITYYKTEKDIITQDCSTILKFERDSTSFISNKYNYKMFLLQSKYRNEESLFSLSIKYFEASHSYDDYFNFDTYNHLDSLKIFTKTFYNVYHKNDIYYTKKEGVIRFELSKQIWSII